VGDALEVKKGFISSWGEGKKAFFFPEEGGGASEKRTRTGSM